MAASHYEAFLRADDDRSLCIVAGEVAIASRPRKLKVFQAQFGFYDTVIAAPSQAAALRAWGTHQNLFADGQARVTPDPEAIAAALAHPEAPLRRAFGSSDAFELDPSSLPTVPDALEKITRKVQPAPRPSSPPADRTQLDSAEAKSRALDDRRKAEEVKLRQRQEALDIKRIDAQKTYVEARKQASAIIDEARQAYKRAGGKP